MYIKNSAAKLHAAQEKVNFESKEAILFQCDTFFVEFMESEEEVEVIAVHLYPEMLKKIYEKDLPATIIQNALNVKSKRIVDSQIISKFIESLEFYFQYPTLVDDDLLELKIKELVLLLIKSKNVDSVLALIKNLYYSKTTNLKDIIALHLYSNLAIEDLAKLSQMSLSTFKRAFKKEFNVTPLNYITHKRIEKAENLLSITERSVSEIAYEVGYNDPQYFTRIFKRKIGVTPTMYRTQNRK